MPPYSLSGRAHGWADGMWMSSTSTPMYLLPCALMKAKKAISEPIHSTGRGLEMCLKFVCLCMKRSLSCQIWGMTLSTPSDSLHHRWHHLLAWLMLNSTAEAHRRWGTVYCTAPLLAVDLSGAIILIVSEAPVMNNWWQKQLMNTTSELWIRKKRRKLNVHNCDGLAVLVSHGIRSEQIWTGVSFGDP